MLSTQTTETLHASHYSHIDNSSNKALPPIYFYIAQEHWPENFSSDNIEPQWIDQHWQLFNPGIFACTLQTYLRLKADGFPCQLTGTMPTEGIVIAYHKSVFWQKWKPDSKVMLVCIVADRSRRHPWAHFHVVLNPQELLSQDGYSIKNTYYIPHWAPQPGLIRRDPARGDRFENITFFGREQNLAPELKHPSWAEQLQALGLRWQIAGEESWNDYSNVDAIVAVRSFDNQDHTVRPALKLYNAWHAGVPAILGRESAFQAERRNELDYLEATSPNQVLAMLQRLRDDVAFRRAMVDNGHLRARETQHYILLNSWRCFLMGTVVPAYKHWCDAPSIAQQAFQVKGRLTHSLERVTRRMLKLKLT
ncbi:hypothetical protein Glo7428_1310 [Gloeocapsa sp. PCC 7428]|uniref:hypothetical protein n=1 Tax=Gloeocapsa sp. PCC 7428 TaxID=1173026 RepID=UPI0002A617FD|nr:hypothetical protein [Gloeocapsa sp. PCC 7428]AFZ29878.1 hypothetical protein Glo7428_1310 [Gloeocapsa sp. PCC 7428]